MHKPSFIAGTLLFPFFYFNKPFNICWYYTRDFSHFTENEEKEYLFFEFVFDKSFIHVVKILK